MLTAALKFPHKIRIQHLSKKNTETPNWIQATIPKPPNPRPGKMKKKRKGRSSKEAKSEGYKVNCNPAYSCSEVISCKKLLENKSTNSNRKTSTQMTIILLLINSLIFTQI
jgi:hypothetical protein